MAITSPTTDQLTFRSSTNGVLNLDAYLEAAERGGRQLGDLLSDLFDTNGNVDGDKFQFRVNGSNMFQARVGSYTDANANWSDITTIFEPRGQFVANTAYNRLDVVGDGSALYIVQADNQSFADVAAFRASANTFVAVSSASALSLASIGDVAVTSVQSGDIIRWSGSEWANEALTSSSLSDVAATTPTNNQILKYNIANTRYEPSDNDLADLTNVSATTPTTNQYLTYTGSEWAPATIEYTHINNRPSDIASTGKAIAMAIVFGS